ncbi:MAG: nuclear transport factor 2 family protein [Gaiellales bacterium]
MPTNIEIIFTDYLDAIRRGDVDAVAARLAPGVTHHGVRADLICPDREAVLASMRRRSLELPAVEALELVAAGDRVVMSVRAEGIGQPLRDEDGPRGQASVVFTLRDGLITAMQDHPSRAQALAAAGARVRQWE